MNKPSKFTSGIPAPDRTNPWTAILKRMNVGDSFILIANRNEQRALYNAAHKVNVRIVTERCNKRIRVWRAK